MRQHPPGRQVGGRIYYGAYPGREGQCKRCLLVSFTILLLLIGAIVTIVGHTLKPFWSATSTSFCNSCAEDNRITQRNAANCRIVGPILLTFGFLLSLFTIYYFKKKKLEGLNAGGSSSAVPASTTLTYNQASQSVNVPYPQSPYSSTQPYPGGSQPYPTATAPQPYPTAPQPYPTAPQPYPDSQQYPAFQSGTPYPPTQQPYPGTTQDNISPPPSYSEVVAGSGGMGEQKH